jgi:exopolyphosphatase/guanosine-5'-triphosphate,3'-diphosphate pyrophosphatase
MRYPVTHMETLPPSQKPVPSEILAVIDIGSNTSRVTVYRMHSDGQYEAIADSRAALKLLQGLNSGKSSVIRATEALMAALQDFQVVAKGAAAQRMMALATYSIRGYEGAAELVSRIKDELGIEVHVIDGTEEAELAYMGAIHSTDADDGMLIDLGGGSLEIAHFRGRALLQTWSLPLGALLLNDRYLSQDVPTDSQINALQNHVSEVLQQAGVSPLKKGERLVTTGGTVRNLAKMEMEERRYAIPQLHGYVLTRRRIKELARRLTTLPRDNLASLPGLKADRKDSIVAGALIFDTLLRLLKAKEAEVSGKGLREGFALTTRLAALPPSSAVRQGAIEALARRFASWDLRSAQRRAGMASALQSTLDPQADEEMQECLRHAAWILDIGAGIDYFSRFELTASILMAADLIGFSHRRLALLAATISTARRRKFDWRIYRPVLSESDDAHLERAALILSLADEIEKRLPPDHGIPLAFHDQRQARLGMYLPVPYGGHLASLADRFPEVFGWELRFEE